MNQKQDNLITVLDAGSTKSIVLVAELQDGVLRYRGHGIEPSRGMRKGLIAELGPAAEAINRAALTAERMAKAGIETAVVGIGGTHVRGVNSRGAASAWAAGCGRLRGKKCGLRWIGRGRLRCRRTARCCICCRRSSSWMTSRGFTIRWGWWGTSLR
jgi:hypothetical protein